MKLNELNIIRCISFLPDDTLGQTLFLFSLYYKRKSGVSGFCLFCSSRPSTALVVNRQSDTHAVGIYSTTLKVCVMAWLAIGTPTGTVYTYPQHLPLQCSRQLIRFVEVSNCQKQSVSDAFQNVVLPPRIRSDIPKKSARREFASTKVQIPL